MQLLLFVLELVEAVVDAALGEQFLMGALFAEAAFVEDEDAVGVLNGAETMRDDERCAADEQTVERFADQEFGLRVNAGSCFVENEEARIVCEGAREIDELPLADAERGAAFVDGGGDAFGQRGDEVGQADFVASAENRFAIDARRAEPNIGLDRAAEEERILKDDAEHAAQVLNIDFADVDAVEEDLTALDVVETE